MGSLAAAAAADGDDSEAMWDTISSSAILSELDGLTDFGELVALGYFLIN